MLQFFSFLLGLQEAESVTSELPNCSNHGLNCNRYSSCADRHSISTENEKHEDVRTNFLTIARFYQQCVKGYTYRENNFISAIFTLIIKIQLSN